MLAAKTVSFRYLDSLSLEYGIKLNENGNVYIDFYFIINGEIPICKGAVLATNSLIFEKLNF